MQIHFATDDKTVSHHFTPTNDLNLSLPFLGGRETEYPHSLYTDLSVQDTGFYRSSDDIELHIAIYSATPSDIAIETERCYENIFQRLDGKHMYRMWTYLPRINEGQGDTENYRRYCLGRAKAYERFYETRPESEMAAGTCVGADGDKIAVVALAGPKAAKHFENPHQVPAYRYPRRYGPRSPSFSRASTVITPRNRLRFISGTAAVIGHETVGANDLARQLKVTCQNLETIVSESSKPEYNARATETAGKVYIRHESDLPKIKSYLESRMPAWTENLTYLRSDICREDLLLEIELTFIDSP